MIYGVDINLHRVSLVALDDREVRPYRYLAYGTSIECPRLIARAVREQPVITESDVVWIERPMGRHIKSVADLMRVMGGFIAALPYDTTIEEVTAPEWKRIIGLPGNASKSVVWKWAMAELLQRHGSVYGSQHDIDAFAVAVACEKESQRATEHEGISA